MHHPTVTIQLRKRGHDVIAVAESADLRALSDEKLFEWAAQHDRWVVTENIRDFRRILARCGEAGDAPIIRSPGVVFTSPYVFPRSRHNLGPLVEALHAWLTDEQTAFAGNEVWLTR